MNIDLSDATWRKSQRSLNNGGCVEVARNLAGIVGIRDSKDQTGPVLVVAPVPWTGFLAVIKEYSGD